ncbi:phosphotransferase [Stutzerimonas stutzeri]|uniref:phosphotransferase n=1 Tax=Stutzerimonas sp. S1 TaxID=3030652 RepID=UPI002225646C|nr:phosphotransferase [Stutzerimonas sp. S1]MCW3148138.1 phosphotransferase [Stutzerimonas sp. S1]
MTVQQEVIDFLACPESYGAPGTAVEIIETHGSLIFLHDERAYKLKRAIAYAALDFLTLDKRERACHAELRLNRRTAPGIYLEVRSITRRSDGRLAFDGAGEVLDWVVVMRRFPQTALFEHMALTGQLTPTLIQTLGAEIARFHAFAEVTPEFGGSAGIRWAIESNHQEMSRYPQLLDGETVQALYRDQLALLERQAPTLEQRRNSGRVRRCHGDMRLANICLFEGRPTLFDGIEFSDRIACIDVLYDLAFVLMDLQHHHLGALVPLLLRAYLESGDESPDCLPLPLPLFLSVRAATRCFTLAGSALRQSTPRARQEKTAQAQALLRQSRIYLLDHQALGLDFPQLSQTSPLSTRSQP